MCIVNFPFRKLSPRKAAAETALVKADWSTSTTTGVKTDFGSYNCQQINLKIFLRRSKRG
jgi:hypothetical protein